MPRGNGPRLHVVADVLRERDAASGRGPNGGGEWAGEAFDWRTELELVAPDVTLPPGASAQAIASAEGSLGLTFPKQQVEFLRATDGVYDTESYRWFAWSLERIVDENFEPERPHDLLLIGDDAASGWFCLRLDHRDGVIHYERTTGERRTVAPDVRGLWLGWFGGTISVQASQRH
jgi:hypothetical protein